MKQLLSVTLIFSLLLLACSKSNGNDPAPPSPPSPPPPAKDTTAFRGVWITTTASTVLDSRENIEEAVKRCKDAHINNIFVVVYNNARTIFPSMVMDTLIGKKQLERFAGRDPLQEIIEACHAQKIKVHAWFEYGFSSSYSAAGGPIIAAKPHWAAQDFDGKLVVKNGFDWLNAFHPEVQQFMLSLVKEVVGKYAVDGIQGDDRLPANPTTAGYDPFTVALYKQENAGINPPASATDAGWIAWRSKKLNAFQKKLYGEIKAMKPGVQVTMSPSVFPFSRTEYLQDWPTWVDSGWADAIIPQVYRYDINAYNTTLAAQKNYFANNPAVKAYAGVLLRVGTYIAADNFLSQMVQSNRQQGFKGEVFFFYEGMRERQTWFQTLYPFIR